MTISSYRVKKAKDLVIEYRKKYQDAVKETKSYYAKYGAYKTDHSRLLERDEDSASLKACVSESVLRALGI